jgi:hypothetical protein
MSFAGQLYETAGRLAKYAQSSAAALEEERLQIEMRKREVEAQLDAANFAHKRLANFVPIRGGDFQCPRCWIDHGTASNLQTTAKNRSSTENFRCGTRHFESSLPQGPVSGRALMRKSLIVNLSLAAALSLGSTSGLAANISLAPLDGDPAHAIVVVEGRLESGDEIQLRTQVGRLTKAIVAFDSDGGNLLAGIAIGKTIRLKSFATAVLDEQRCVSACAIAWLGGTPRFMGRTAHVGFHAAYIEEAGRASESGVGNALVGSYLTQIGLSEIAVVYITQAPPTELTLLTLPDAEKIGIEVLPFEEQTPATKPAPAVTSREASNEEISGRARLFVKEINSRFSRTNVAEWFGPLYADEVNFNGKLISRGEVVTQHRRFAERWPERSYIIQDKSMNAVCGERAGLAQSVPQPPVECIVTVTVEWAHRSLARNAATSGLGSVTYVLRASGNTFVIKGEQGTVIKGEHGTVLQRGK